MSERYNDSIAEVKRYMLNKLLYNTYESLSSTEKSIYHQIDNSKDCYQIVLVKVDKYLSSFWTLEHKDAGKYNYIEKIISEALNTEYSYKYLEFMVYILIGGQKYDRIFFDNLCRKVFMETSNTISVYISKPENCLGNLHKVFERSVHTLINKRFYHGRNKVYEPVESVCDLTESTDLFEINNIKHNLRKSICTLNYDNMVSCLSNLKDEIIRRELSCSVRSVKNLIILLIEYVKGIFLKEFNIDIEFMKNAVSFKMIDDMDVLEDVFLLFETTLKNSMIKVLEMHGSNNNIINSIKFYIKDNFSDPDISLEKVSQQYHMNLSYLSNLFKKEVGMNFTDYLTKIRINEAKSLLEYSEIKIDDIGDRVGYKNIKYFYSVFKKETGVSPNTYRKMNRQSV